MNNNSADYSNDFANLSERARDPNLTEDERLAIQFQLEEYNFSASGPPAVNPNVEENPYARAANEPLIPQGQTGLYRDMISANQNNSFNSNREELLQQIVSQLSAQQRARGAENLPQALPTHSDDEDSSVRAADQQVEQSLLMDEQPVPRARDGEPRVHEYNGVPILGQGIRANNAQRRRQLNQQAAVQQEESQEEARERQKRNQNIMCFILVMVFLIITPSYNCEQLYIQSLNKTRSRDKQTSIEQEPDLQEHIMSLKTWIIVYFTISFLQMLREDFNKKINSMYRNDRITYRRRSQMKIAMIASIEFLHFLWQVYGNFLYYNQSENKKIVTCNERKNSGFYFTMFMILILGYIYFVIYALFFLLITTLYLRRYLSQRNRVSQSATILRSISRIKFSEELFGAISDENECIICMTPFQQTDTITKLNCTGNHFYHTACIENWIKQGSNQCPMCRQPINGDVPMSEVDGQAAQV